MSGPDDIEMADYVQEHRCYKARPGVSIADWDRGIAAIEEAAARRALEGVVERVAEGLSRGYWPHLADGLKDSYRVDARTLLGLDPEPRP